MINDGMYSCTFVICLNINMYFIFYSDICYQWAPAQRQRMKMERNPQTSSTQSAKTSPNCLRLAASDWIPGGSKGKQTKITERRR